MQLPHFSLSNFGVSHVKNTKKEASPIRFYELEFYTEDYPGGTITDGVFRAARKGYYCIYRPGQMQRLVAPYRCPMRICFSNLFCGKIPGDHRHDPHCLPKIQAGHPITTGNFAKKAESACHIVFLMVIYSKCLRPF